MAMEDYEESENEDDEASLNTDEIEASEEE